MAASGLFFEVAAKVFAQLGIAPDANALTEHFVAARMEAERRARRQCGREEITLQEIWQILCRLMGWKYDDFLPGCELAAEAESLIVISSIRARIQAARRQQQRVIFTSDMYLPAAFIREQLLKHGLAEVGDAVYVSSETGRTKATGGLYRHILKREKLAADELSHLGDNEQSDFAVPRAMGIKAELVQAAKLTQTESGITQTDINHGLAAKVAGTMRGFRLSTPSWDQAVHELASQFAGPFVMGFAVWLLNHARAQGKKRLYFAARDCQLLCKVARQLAPQFGGIECRYLYISRQSLFLPSAGAISSDGMPWMRRDWEKPVLKKLLAKLELNFSAVAPSLEKMVGETGESFTLKSEDNWSCFWSALNTDPVRTRINALVTERRKLTLQYLRAEGFFDSVPWAVVDLGWTLSCQQALWRLLKLGGWLGIPTGYYLGLARNRVAPSEAGDAEALYFQPPADFPAGTDVSAVFARSTLLEHIVGCADHPTVHHHGETASGEVGPLYTAPANAFTADFSQRLHTSVLNFVEQNASLARDFKDEAVCRSVLLALVRSFFQSPTELSARALLGLSATSDQNGLNTVPIVKQLGWNAILPNRNAQLRSEQDGFWLEGSMAVTPAKVRRSLNLARRAAHHLPQKLKL